MFSIDPALRLQLAEALFGRNANVRLLEADNSGNAWEPLAVAVADGVAHAGLALPDFVALEFDTETVGHLTESIPAYAEKVAAALNMAGLDPVTWQSGRPGHRHVLAKAPSSAEALHLKSVLQECGVPRDCFRMGGHRLIRPPLSPHRLGFPVSICGRSPEDAVRALTTHPTGAQLPDGAKRIARGDEDHRYVQKSGTISRHKREQGFVTAAVRAGCSVQTILTQLLRPANLAGEKVRELPTDASRLARVRRGRDSALRHLFNSPTIGDRASAAEALAALVRVAEDQDWKGLAARSERLVLEALLDTASTLGTFRVGASIRQLQLQLQTGLGSKDTVASALRRLTGKGWLAVDCGSDGGLSTVYRLKQPSEFRTLTGPLQLMGNRPKCPSLSTLKNHDAFAPKALGPRAYFVLGALTNEGQTNTALQHASQHSYKPVKAALNGLAEFGLAECVDRLWRLHPDLLTSPELLEPRLSEVAWAYSTTGRGKRLEAIHAEQRQAFAECLAFYGRV